MTGLTPLRGGAAKSAGERRAHVGSDHDLLGRLLRRHLMIGRRRSAGRIDQAAVLDDFFDLHAVESLKFKKRLGDYLKLVTMGCEDLLRGLVGIVDELAHFAVDLLGGGLAIVASARDVAAEK